MNNFRVNYQSKIHIDVSHPIKAHSFSLVNNGNTVVTIDGNFDLSPGESISHGLLPDNSRYIQEINIKFGPQNAVDGINEPYNCLNVVQV